MRGGNGVTWSNFSWRDASEDVLEAMTFRCGVEGHDWRGAAGFGVGGSLMGVYELCHWCGGARMPTGVPTREER